VSETKMRPSSATAIPIGPLKRAAEAPPSADPALPSTPAIVRTSPDAETDLIVFEPESATISSPLFEKAIAEGVSKPAANSETTPSAPIFRIFPFAPSETKVSAPFHRDPEWFAEFAICSGDG
jgi:hypothetical protein